MSSWQALDDELAAWAAAGQRATFWWRDDDAAEDCPDLAQLLDLAETTAVPLVIAAIPATLRDAAVARIDASTAPQLAIVQHGYAHTDHARGGEKKIELGGTNRAQECRAHLHMGFEILSERFGARFLPTLVPPWNRIDPALIDHLPAVGYRTLSTYGARKAARTKFGLKQINCHIDIVNWRQGAAFVGEAAALELACTHLRARRQNEVDMNEPTGLMSHHLRQDAAAWQFMAAFFAHLSGHPGAHWPKPTALFGKAAK